MVATAVAIAVAAAVADVVAAGVAAGAAAVPAWVAGGRGGGGVNAVTLGGHAAAPAAIVAAAVAWNEARTPLLLKPAMMRSIIIKMKLLSLKKLDRERMRVPPV